MIPAFPWPWRPGEAGPTLALEPNPYVFEILKVNAAIESRAKTNIVPLNFAATEHDGVFVFNYSDGAFLQQRSYCRRSRTSGMAIASSSACEACNLEQVLRPGIMANSFSRLSFIKIDTEGYDRQVITLDVLPAAPVSSGDRVPRSCRDWWPPSEKHLFDALDQAGYEPFQFR